MSAFDNERSESRTVNLSYDNLAEVVRQLKLAKRRLAEGKSFHVEQHVDRALYHLELHKVQQEQIRSQSLATSRQVGE